MHCRILRHCRIAAISAISVCLWFLSALAGSKTRPDLDTTVLEFLAKEGTWMSVDVSPDGKKLAFDLLGHLYEMPITGGRARVLTDSTSWNLFPRYSPDGSHLLYTSDASGSNDLWTLELATGQKKNISKMDLPVYQGTWSLDGRHVYGSAIDMKLGKAIYQFNLYGDKQLLVPSDGWPSAVHMVQHPDNDLFYFEYSSGNLFHSGPQIKTYNARNGEVAVYIQRPGGASMPTLSRDGRQLAYVHRDDQQTVLVVHNLATREEKVLFSGLDFGRLESSGFYGSYSNMSWHPDDNEIFIAFGGGIHAINTGSGAVRDISFEAPVRREMTRTMRFKTEVPDKQAKTRSHRWGQKTPDGILFEALGDLYIKSDDKLKNLTNSSAHETNPVFDPVSEKIYFASWNDDELGALYSMQSDGTSRKKLTSVASQYGSISSSPDGRYVGFLRGDGAIHTGTHLEDQTGFELIIIGPDGKEQKVTDIEWSRNRYAKRPPTIRFSEDSKYLYFTEYVDDALTLKRMTLTGLDEQTLYTFPNATRVVLSPTFEWMAFREYHRSYVTPFEFAGKEQKISAADHEGFTKRIDRDEDGDFTEWSPDGKALWWTRGKYFCEKTLDAVLNDEEETSKTDLSFSYDLLVPGTTIALTGVRVLTMNSMKEIIENATVVIKENRITEVGPDVTIPADAKVYDLKGRTIMPGMFDAHGHYGSPISALNVIEQRLYGLHANLAYGVTTMYDVYGTTQKDFWVSDMLQKGEIVGPRLYSVGDPMFLTKYRTKMYRPIKSPEEAEEHVQFNKDHGALAVKDYSNHTRQTRQYLAAACRKLGINIVTESFGDPQMNMTQIIDGYTGIEHTMGLEPIYDDVIRLFAASKIGMTPTLLVVYNGPGGETYFWQHERLWEDEKLLHFFTKDELIELRRPQHYWPDDEYAARMARDLKKLYAKNVSLQMGAHGEMMGLGAHWEMELFTHGGFSNYDAIEIATINGFRHHGLDHELGSVEVGKLADLVILTRNPLDNIRNTRSIEYVIKNGVLYSGKDAARVYPDPAPARPLYFQ